MRRSGVIDKLKTADPMTKDLKTDKSKADAEKFALSGDLCLGYIVLTYLLWLCSTRLKSNLPIQPPYVVLTVPSLSSSHVSHSPPGQHRPDTPAPNSVIR